VLDSLSILHLIAAIEDFTGRTVPITGRNETLPERGGDLCRVFGITIKEPAMNQALSSPVRNGDTFTDFERLDARLSAWARAQGGEEHRYPVLIATETLHRAEYPTPFHTY
jgi:hypothetical protein